MPRCRPQVLSLNCNGSKMAIIDINGIFSLYNFGRQLVNTETDSLGLSAGSTTAIGMPNEEHLAMERKVMC